MRYGDRAVLAATWRDHFRCACRCGCLRNDGSAAAQPSDWLVFFQGGMTSPLYSLLLAHTLDWSEPSKAIGASSSLLRINAAGAVIGPVITSSFMVSTEPTAFSVR